jgi:hypothetical protein
MSLLDDWYDMSKVRVMKAGEPIDGIVRLGRTGFLITEVGSPFASEISKVSAGNSPIWLSATTPRFLIYEWPTKTSESRVVP